jgi:hypothetical protein
MIVGKRRVINTRESKRIGKCIYCGSTAAPLTEEHVTPYSLGGSLVLLEASCNKCQKITSAFERKITREQLFAARAALRSRSRRPQERLKPRSMLIEKDGQIQTVNALWQDQWKVIRLPIFPLPAYIDGRAYSSGIESHSMDVIELGEKACAVAAKHGAQRLVPSDYPLEEFARFIAKIAFGYAIEHYTLEAFDEFFIIPAILGETLDIGRWIGCPDQRTWPVRKGYNISVGYGIMAGTDDVFVKVKMFPEFDGAEYIAVIGRIKPIYRNYFQAGGQF